MELPKVDSWLVDYHKAAWLLDCKEQQVKQYVNDGLLREFRVTPRLVRLHTNEVLALAEHRRFGVPITNEPPIAYKPMNCLVIRDTASPKATPVRTLPTKQFYVYVLRRLDGRPFYVGKGKGGRAEEHIAEARKGQCQCRKCKIIQGILKLRRSVDIEYPYETDNARAALQYESKITQELSQQHNLCNVANNRGRWSFHLIGPHMSLPEVTAYLDELDLPTRERDRHLKDWAHKRGERLEKDWRVARLNGKWEESDRILEELTVLRGLTGDVFQHQFFADGDNFYTTKREAKQSRRK